MSMSGKFEIPSGKCQGIFFPSERGNPGLILIIGQYGRLLHLKIQMYMYFLIEQPKTKQFSYAKTKADQLYANLEADQSLCFSYTDSTIPLLLKSKISSFYPASVTVQACVGPGRKPKLLVFSCEVAILTGQQNYLSCMLSLPWIMKKCLNQSSSAP